MDTITNFAKHIGQSAVHALVTSLLIASLLVSSYFLIEPAVSRSQTVDTESFTVNQVITGEHSLLISTTSLGMVGSIGGVVGGQATGTVEFSVTSNNTSGYTVDIEFDPVSALSVMEGNVSNSDAIRNYTWGTSTPSYNFLSSTSAQFAYTVESVDGQDAPQIFLNNGNLCNQIAGSQTTNKCWKSPSTTPVTIVESGDASLNAASTTITFSVVVPSGVNPVVAADTYTATATLTLILP